MKTLILTPLLLLFYILSLNTLYGQRHETVYGIQNQISESPSGQMIHSSKFIGIEFEKTECLTEEQRFAMAIENAQNRQIILEKNPEAFSKLNQDAVLFIEPFRPKTGFSDYGYHTLQNQVDHDMTPNNHLKDYNCGEKTYDWSNGNHQGTDYILWPYPWLRMSENLMEVVAAADGVIVNKRDGYNDLNCLNNGNPYWNGFVLEHADGSQTIYMHFKKETLNPKEIGEMVSAGEYLGVAGSSGSSTIPHLHFEVRKSGNILVDPYAGPCNSMNTETWWIEQEAYKIPTINEIATHSESTLDNDCPNVENTYYKTNFTQGDLLSLVLYFRDISDGDATQIKFIKPDQTILYDWTWTSDWGVYYPTAVAYWEFIVDSNWMDGIYTIQATFDGRVYETLFGINTELSLEESVDSNLEIYPNPVKDKLHIKWNTNIQKIDVLGADGRLYSKIKWNSNSDTINLSHLPKGVYVLRIWTDNEVVTRKILKE